MASRIISYLLEDLRALNHLLFKRHWKGWVRLDGQGSPSFLFEKSMDRLAAMQPARPGWMSDGEPLLRTVEGWEHSIRNGKIVWGAIVSANYQMWSPGSEDCPGLVVWSPEQEFLTNPQALENLAEKIGHLRQASEVDPSLEDLRAFLKDRLSRESFLLVPKILTNGRIAVLSTIMVFRKHLPKGYLEKTIVPVCVGEEWDFPLLLPSPAWGNRFSQWWSQPDRTVLFKTRISMIGGRGKREATLPGNLRHFLTANIQLNPWLVAVPFLMCLIGWVGTSPYLDQNPSTDLQKFAMIGFGFTLLSGCMGLFVLSIVMIRSWVWHQHLIDLYEGLWKIGGVPWSRFYLFPQRTQFLHTFGLVAKVVGHWFSFTPSFERGEFLATVTEASSDRTEITGPLRHRRLMKIPSNEQEQARALSELKELFREFGEILRSNAKPEDLQKDPDASV